MKHLRQIEVLRLGPLEVSEDPPFMFWHGLRRHFIPSQIKLLAALIETPMMPPPELADRIGLESSLSLMTRVTQLRRTLKAADILLEIVSVIDPATRMLVHYRLEIGGAGQSAESFK